MHHLDNLTPYLLNRGLIDREWIVDGVLSVHAEPRRNYNLRVEGPGGDGLLIKQHVRATVNDRCKLDLEAWFYEFCQSKPALAEISSIVPCLVYHDQELQLLALRLERAAQSMWSYYMASEARQAPIGAGGPLGHALGTVHRLFRQLGLRQDQRLASLPTTVPWAMTVHRPCTSQLANLSAANLELIRTLQMQDGLADRLELLCKRWQNECLIHGDLRFDNVLIRPRTECNAGEAIIVDWEMVQHGDPAWDLAGALQDYIGCWVSSMPLSLEISMEERAAQARFPLNHAQAEICSMCECYSAALNSKATHVEDLIDRAVEFSGARMIQTAYELSYRSPELSPISVVLLQISANLLAEPEAARRLLYGIPRLS